MMWEALPRPGRRPAARDVAHGAAASSPIEHDGGEARAVVADGPTATAERHAGDDVISSMPIGAAARAMDPPAPAEVRAAADALRYRDFLTVALVVPEQLRLPRQLDLRPRARGQARPHPELRLVVAVHGARTAAPASGSSTSSSRATSWWTMPDDDLVALGKRELEQLGLVRPGEVEAGYVVRMPKAYPVYDDAYAANVDVLRAWLDEHAANVHPVGRNGMHQYNNQDHSMYTAMLTVENIADGRRPRRLGGQRRGGVPRGAARRAAVADALGDRPRRADSLSRRPRLREVAPVSARTGTGGFRFAPTPPACGRWRTAPASSAGSAARARTGSR